MRGSIYSEQKCPVCGESFQLHEKSSALMCPNHPDHRATDRFYVRFGRKIQRRFGADYFAAERFLIGLRYEVDKGTFDPRDYQGNFPLGFKTLAEKWLTVKKKTVSPSHYCNLQRFMNAAVSVWGQQNIKCIGFGELEDFLLSQNVSSKTKSNIRSCLHSFFHWVERREQGQYKMPEIPEVKFSLGFRKIVDKATQEKIIEEIKRLTYQINPKIWLGVKWLSTYISIRPKEMMNLKEGEVDIRTGHFFIPHPKEDKFKIIPMLPEDIELIKQLPQGLPGLYFFRHVPGISGCTPGQQFGEKYFYKWWKKACENLGIVGVDLYGGTKHSTASALRKVLSPEQIQRGAKISTNDAFYRYLQMNDSDALMVYSQANNLTSGEARTEHQNKLLRFAKNK